MTQNETKPTGKRALSEEKLTDLLREAGPRPEVPERDLIQIRIAAEETWRELALRQRKKTSYRRLGWAAAATLAVVALAFFLKMQGSLQVVVGPVLVADVAVLDGVSWVEIDGSTERRELREAESVAVGSYVETLGDESGASRMAIRFHSGANLRLDLGTRILIESENRIELLAGAVYLDSESPLEGADLVVQTALGEVHEVGTQFEARLLARPDLADSLRVRVREGAVRIEQEKDVFGAGVGEELTLFADGSPKRQTIPLYGPTWSWILHTAMPLEEGSSCGDLLHWIGRETGWQIVTPSELSGQLRGELTGAEHFVIQDLIDDPSLALQSCGLDGSVEEGRLLVSPTP